MLVEPRTPDRAQIVAGLQDRLEPRAVAAAHQPKMAAVLAREQLGDGVGLAMPLDAQHDGVVSPLHRFEVYSAGNSRPMARKRSGSSPQPSRTLTNRNRCTFASAISLISLRAASPIALIVCPALPSTILRWLSRST